jgi:hypothetical protein
LSRTQLILSKIQQIIKEIRDIKKEKEKNIKIPPIRAWPAGERGFNLVAPRTAKANIYCDVTKRDQPQLINQSELRDSISDSISIFPQTISEKSSIFSDKLFDQYIGRDRHQTSTTTDRNNNNLPSRIHDRDDWDGAYYEYRGKTPRDTSNLDMIAHHDRNPFPPDESPCESTTQSLPLPLPPPSPKTLLSPSYEPVE